MDTIVKNIIKNNTENINTKDVDIVPCNTNVLIEFYPSNPYRELNVDKSGIILGVESSKQYRSNESGEYVQNEQMVQSAKVLAIGSKCHDVKVGDDIFFMNINAMPIPFRNKDYYITDEQHIICVIREK